MQTNFAEFEQFIKDKVFSFLLLFGSHNSNSRLCIS